MIDRSPGAPRSAARIVVVDDEDQLRSLIVYALRGAGFEVEGCRTGDEALEHVQHHACDLIVLDVVLPDHDGVELCRQLRRHTEAPIVFLTARADQADVIAGLEAGGDDYLAKPFSIEELLLRIRAILRRSSTQRPDEIRIGGLVLDLDGHEARLDDRPLDLTRLELKLLRYLAVNRNRIVPTIELVEEVWGVADLGAYDPIVKTAVYRIRQKLGARDQSVEIRNVRGVGYQLRPLGRGLGS